VYIAWWLWKERFVPVTCLGVWSIDATLPLQEEERKGGKKGRLLGIITLSDVLRYVIGPVDIPESVEPPEEPPNGPPTLASATTTTTTES
jgi:CBS domain-containing protein